MIEATANILIGGKSQRFGSEKWKAKLGSKIILTHILNSCKNFKHLNLIGKKKPNNINYTFISDHYDIQAPLIGLHSAIISSNTEWILLIACDLPLINENCLKFIWDSKIEGFDSVIPIVKGKMQPLCALYNINILKKLNLSIQNKQFSIKKFINSINAQFLEIVNYKNLFLNMNTINDYREIKLIYKEKSI